MCAADRWPSPSSSGSDAVTTAIDPRAAQGVETLRDAVRAAAADGRPLRLRGGGTKSFYGEPFDGGADGTGGGAPATDLDLRDCAGIVSYEPTELVVTARCGTLLAELEAALAERQQFLPFEPPHFGEGATVGGMVAAGLSGPRRASAGSVRDYVLGAVLMDAQGELLHFGGQVMKNVAGYDVSRLLTGSLGILGPIVQVSLKVLPLPPAESTLRLRCGLADALDAFNAWGGQPLPVSGTAFHDGELTLRLSGARAAVDAACSRLASTHGAEAVEAPSTASFWTSLRDQTAPFFAGNTPLWRLSVPSAAPPLTLDGPQLIEWGGALRWLRSDAPADAIRRAAVAVGGTATLFRSHERATGRLHPLAPANFELHRRLKRELDPRGLFNPGRMYPGL
jgi:glycolate oxidase FAD binding subunit